MSCVGTVMGWPDAGERMLWEASMRTLASICASGDRGMCTAIKINPLVCTAFNDDFDGDQMAEHIALAPAAQIEASVLMLASHNIRSPASGQRTTLPPHDMV